jgi:hypothetical protein
MLASYHSLQVCIFGVTTIASSVISPRPVSLPSGDPCIGKMIIGHLSLVLLALPLSITVGRILPGEGILQRGLCITGSPSEGIQGSIKLCKGTHPASTTVNYFRVREQAGESYSSLPLMMSSLHTAFLFAEALTLVNSGMIYGQ